MSLPRYLLFLLLILRIDISSAQTGIPDDSAISKSGYIVINDITLIGNKKTKSSIVFRELEFKQGDTIHLKNLDNILLKTKNRIFNTGIFTSIEFHLIDIDADHVYKNVFIMLKERWYYLPYPIFELADRNFNEWWEQRNHDLKRINVGVFYVQKNVRGRNETLKAKLQFGFTKKMELFYFIPYINKKQHLGLNLEASYIRNKQVAYKTTDNKLSYVDFDHIAREKLRTGFFFTVRNKFYQTHLIGATYNYNWIADTIKALNPDYLRDSKNTQHYLSAKYAFVFDKRDIAYYPLKGSLLKIEVEKLGLGVDRDLNMLNLIAEVNYFRPLKKKLYFAFGAKQKLSFPTWQPYLQTRALGYENDYVSGYELYVIDGQSFSLSKVNLKWRLFATKNYKNQILDYNSRHQPPLAVYIKTYTDAGYVVDNTFNPGSIRFTNKLLVGTGAGFDFVTIYDLSMSLEYSFTMTGQQGFYIHFGKRI